MKLLITHLQRIISLLTLSLLVTTCTPTKEPDPKPVASFTYYPTTNLVAPTTISFSNTSQNADSYVWTYGTGQTSTNKDLSLNINSGGTYTITLTATGKGGTDSYSRTITVSTPAPTTPPPTAGFSYSPSANLVAPATVAFTNASSNATSYKWDFGDGTTSTTASPSKTFANDGTYTVKLTATGAGGSAETSKSLVVAKAAAATGQVVFWTDQSSGWSSIDVSISGTSVGSITGYSTTAPSCGSSKVVTISRSPGTYAYSAKSNTGVTWSGNITVTANQCNTWKLTFPATASCDFTAWAQYLKQTKYTYDPKGGCTTGWTQVSIQNTSNVNFAIKICIQGPDGKWSCGLENIAPGKEFSDWWTCGRALSYKAWGMPSSKNSLYGDGSCSFPVFP